MFVLPADGGTARQLTDGAVWMTARRVWSAGRKAHRLLRATGTRTRSTNRTTARSTRCRWPTARSRRSRRATAPTRIRSSRPTARRSRTPASTTGTRATRSRRLYVMNRDGIGLAARLGERSTASRARSTWAATATALYFQYDDQGDTKLGFVTLDGQVEDPRPSWAALDLGRPYGGGSFSVAHERPVRLHVTTPDHPADIAVGAARRSGRCGSRALNDDLFGAQELGAGRGDLVRVVVRPAQDPGLDREAAGLRPGEEVSAGARDPRRPVRVLRRRASPPRCRSTPRPATSCSTRIRAAARATARSSAT